MQGNPPKEQKLNPKSGRMSHDKHIKLYLFLMGALLKIPKCHSQNLTCVEGEFGARHREVALPRAIFRGSPLD